MRVLWETLNAAKLASEVSKTRRILTCIKTTKTQQTTKLTNDDSETCVTDFAARPILIDSYD